MTAAPGASPALAGIRLMIVEDDFLLAMDYEEIFRREGCEVSGPFPREAKAIARLEQVRPDVVLLDLNLGGQRPTTLARTLAEAGVPFLVVSGYGPRSVEDPVFRDVPRLSKPTNPRQLVNAIAALVRRS